MGFMWVCSTCPNPADCESNMRLCDNPDWSDQDNDDEDED